MKLTLLDWAVIAAYFLFNFLVGLWYRRRATGSTSDYFVGGGNVSWWLAGTSLVATTFAADTPLAVTELVAQNGIAGNWVWWSMLLSGMLTVFFFARLWKRSGVTTDVEFAELRYGGKPATFLRGFRAFYLAIPVNCIILGWVNLAMVKILQVIFPDLSLSFIGITDPKTAALVVVFGLMLVTASISTLSGLWGVLVTDFFQFILKMGMVIILAYYSVKAVGGMDMLLEKLRLMDTARSAAAVAEAAKTGAVAGDQGSILNFMPSMDSAWMPLLAFCVYLGMTWWASWYPGAEPGGGGYVVQRIMCAKNEKHSLLATLWFCIAHYAVRPWPWILAAMASLVLYPDLAADEKGKGFVMLVMDPNVFPVMLRGVMIAAFAAAYMSTISTQLNWGASYLVSDLYRRFLEPNRDDKHYVNVAQVATLVLMVVSCVVTYFQTSISGAWQFMMAIGAGTGAVYILRWYWWRINAWSEVSAMAGAFVVSMALSYSPLKSIVTFAGPSAAALNFAWTVIITTACTSAIWLVVTLLTPPEDESLLLAFYRKVQPSATLWGPIARKATDVKQRTDGLHNLLDWVLGCTMVYAALFGMGKVLFGETGIGIGLLVLAIVSGVSLYAHLQARGWSVIGE